MGVSYFASAKERAAAAREAAMQRNANDARIEDVRRRVAAKIVMAVVDKVVADIIRPGPSPEERECYGVSGTAPKFTSPDCYRNGRLWRTSTRESADTRTLPSRPLNACFRTSLSLYCLPSLGTVRGTGTGTVRVRIEGVYGCTEMAGEVRAIVPDLEELVTRIFNTEDGVE